MVRAVLLIGTWTVTVLFFLGETDERHRGRGAKESQVADILPWGRSRHADVLIRVRRSEGADFVPSENPHAKLNGMVGVQPTIRLHNFTWSAPFDFFCFFLPRDAIRIPWCGVCPSVTFMYSVEVNKHILKLFPPLASHTILVFFRTKHHGSIPMGPPTP